MKQSNVLMIGGGEVATNLAKQMIGIKHNQQIRVEVNLVIFEKDEMLCQKLTGQVNGSLVAVDGTEPQALAKTLIAHQTDFVIALTNDDNSNLMACFLSKQIANGLGLKQPKTIARLKQSYHVCLNDQKECELVNRFDIDHLVFLEKIWAENIFHKLVFPQIKSLQAIYHNHVILLQVEIDELNELCGQRVRDFKPDVKEKITFCAIKEKQSGEVKLPSLDYVLAQGDVIYLLIPREKLDLAIQALGLKALVPKKVIIASDQIKTIEALVDLIGSKTSSAIEIILQNRDLATAMEDKYGHFKLTSMAGSALDDDFLRSRITQDSVYLAAFSKDETNMSSGFKAKSFKAARALVVTKNDQNSYLQMAQALNLEHAPNPKELISQNLIEYLHIEMGENAFEFVLTDKEKDEHIIQIMEFHVPEHSPLVAHQIFEIKSSEIAFPKNAVIMLVIRNKLFYLPENDLLIQANDHLLIVGDQSTQDILERKLLLEFTKYRDKLSEEPVVEHKEEKKKKLFGIF
jgi:trk system potassium uptake protein TrkA